MQKTHEAYSGPVFFSGQQYDSLKQVPGVANYKVKAVNRLVNSPPGSHKKFPEIIARDCPDGKVFLAYKGVSLVPTSDSLLLAPKAAQIAREQANGRFTAFDVGTGTGLFAVYLAESLERCPGAVVVGSDISGAALEVASINFKLNSLTRMPVLRKRDLLQGLVQEFGKPHLIVSNPPFYNTGRFTGTGFEPAIALDGGSEGLDFYRKIFQQGPAILTHNGMILLQIQELNKYAIAGIAMREMPLTGIGFIKGTANKICGLLAGPQQIIQRYTDEVLQ